MLKVSPLSQDIDNSLRQKQLDIYRADKRIREREGIEPDPNPDFFWVSIGYDRLHLSGQFSATSSVVIEVF